MNESTVDCRGMLCPQPLIATKKALTNLPAGGTLRILIDNETSKSNVLRFLSDNGCASSSTESNGVFSITVAKTKDQLVHPDAERYCTVAPQTGAAGHVVVIASDRMGDGPEELGSILIKAFVNTIIEVAPLPSKIIFYNRGILLTTEGSSLIDSLTKLEDAGVAILVCGTCVNYFEKQQAVRVGIVSNMYTILEALTSASRVVRP